MANANQLCDEMQAARLFDELQTRTNVHGFGFGNTATWYVGSVVLPSVVLKHSEIEVAQAEGYSFMAFAPKIVEDDASRQLFGDQRSGVLTATINLRQRGDVEVHSPKPDIQYRLRQFSSTGITELDKLYLGESVDFGVLDEKQGEQRRREQTAELLAELPDLPYDISDVDERDRLRILGTIGNILGRELEETIANRESADQLARALGLTAVFHDEAQALIDFLAILADGGPT